MTERLEIDQRRRFDAGVEAIELLVEAGFYVEDFDITTEDPREPNFQVEADLVIGEDTNPLDVIEDDDVDLGRGFALGYTAALMTGECGPCDRDDCPRGSE